jgi:hypothetical protein
MLKYLHVMMYVRMYACMHVRKSLCSSFIYVYMYISMYGKPRFLNVLCIIMYVYIYQDNQNHQISYIKFKKKKIHQDNETSYIVLT